MADLSFSATLDDRGFQAGLNRMKADSLRVGAIVGRLLPPVAGFLGARKVFSELSESVDAYGKINSLARSEIERATAAHDRLQETVGREIGVVSDLKTIILGGLTVAMDKASVAADLLGDSLSFVFGGDGFGNARGVREAQFATEGADREFARLKEQHDKTQKAQEEIMRLSATARLEKISAYDPNQGAKDRANAEYEETAKKVRALTEGFSPERMESSGANALLFDASSIRFKKIAEAQGRIFDERDAAQAKARQQEEAHQEALAKMDMDLARSRLSLDKSSSGDTKAIRLRELELDYWQRIDDAQREANLTLEERQEYVQALNQEWYEARKQIENEPAKQEDRPLSRFSLVASGLAGTAADAVLGEFKGPVSNPALDQSRKQTGLLEKTVGQLVEINRRLASPAVAVYGQ